MSSILDQVKKEFPTWKYTSNGFIYNLYDKEFRILVGTGDFSFTAHLGIDTDFGFDEALSLNLAPFPSNHLNVGGKLCFVTKVLDIADLEKYLPDLIKQYLNFLFMVQKIANFVNESEAPEGALSAFVRSIHLANMFHIVCPDNWTTSIIVVEDQVVIVYHDPIFSMEIGINYLNSSMVKLVVNFPVPGYLPLSLQFVKQELLSTSYHLIDDDPKWITLVRKIEYSTRTLDDMFALRDQVAEFARYANLVITACQAETAIEIHRILS